MSGQGNSFKQKARISLSSTAILLLHKLSYMSQTSHLEGVELDFSFFAGFLTTNKPTIYLQKATNIDIWRESDVGRIIRIIFHQESSRPPDLRPGRPDITSN